MSVNNPQEQHPALWLWRPLGFGPVMLPCPHPAPQVPIMEHLETSRLNTVVGKSLTHRNEEGLDETRDTGMARTGIKGGPWRG